MTFRPMLDGEFKRFKIALWLLDPLLVIVPIGLWVWAAYRTDNFDLYIIALEVSLQNLFIWRVLSKIK